VGCRESAPSAARLNASCRRSRLPHVTVETLTKPRLVRKSKHLKGLSDYHTSWKAAKKIDPEARISSRWGRGLPSADALVRTGPSQPPTLSPPALPPRPKFLMPRKG